MSATLAAPRETTAPPVSSLMTEPERRRLLDAMCALAGEHGWRRVTVERLCEHARVDRARFEACFADPEECFAAVVAEALATICAGAEAAMREPGQPWERRAARAIAEVFATLSDDQVLAWLCVIEPLSASAPARAAREQGMARLEATLAPDDANRGASPVLVGRLWSALEQRLLADDPVPLEQAVSSAIYMTLVGVVGPATALHEAAAAITTRPATAWPQSRPLAPAVAFDRDAQALLHLMRWPGASNAEIARSTGDRHESQISRRLAALRRAGLLRCRRAGRHNAWDLTEEGRTAALRHERDAGGG